MVEQVVVLWLAIIVVFETIFFIIMMVQMHNEVKKLRDGLDSFASFLGYEVYRWGNKHDFGISWKSDADVPLKTSDFYKFVKESRESVDERFGAIANHLKMHSLQSEPRRNRRLKR